MRAKLQNLNDRSEFVAGMDAGARAIAIAPVANRPGGSPDLDAGRWLRDPSTGEEAPDHDGG
jgi:hypothetical protein